MVCEKLDSQLAANQKCARTWNIISKRGYEVLRWWIFQPFTAFAIPLLQGSSSKLYLEPLFQSFADVYNLYLTKSKESNQRPLSRQVLKNISDGLTLALFHRHKYQSDVCVGYDCDYTDEHQEGTDGAQSTKSADKGTATLSSNSAGDKTSVCCMDLQAVVLTPRISRKQNCVFTFYNLATKDVQATYGMKEKMRWLQTDLHLVWHSLLQIILNFQRTFCIAMGPPIRTDIPPYQRLCYVLLSHTMWR